MELLYFSSSSTLSTTEKPGHYVQNKCRKILGDRKKTEWPGSSEPEKCAPFFASCIPKTEPTKPITWNHKWLQTKRAPTKFCSLAKEPSQKSQLSKIETFRK